MRKSFEEFKNDRVQYLSVICGLIILGFQIYEYLIDGYLLESLIRCSFWIIYPIVVLLSGRKGIYWSFLVFSLILVQFIEYTNFSSFIIVLLFILIYPKCKWHVIPVYVLDVIIVCIRHDRTPAHLIIHYLCCAFIYFAAEIINAQYRKNILTDKQLVLDESERYILEKLAAGYKQKEIDGYSENTVSKKLKKCRKVNSCSTNSELIMKFIEQNP